MLIPAHKVIPFLTAVLCVWYGVANAQDHPCYRTCVEGESMECVYNFTLEYYQSMSKACYSCPLTIDDCAREDCVPAGGTKRTIITVNRQIPGPSIDVCTGDTIVVNVLNMLISEASTIHWHGQHQQDTPYMDGVPYVTQCPIEPGSTFTYRFPAVQTGTQFYHSHSGLQRGDGLYGPLVVRQPAETNPHSDIYDYDLSEHTMIINEWTDEGGLEKFLANYHSDGNNVPDGILVNGKGRYEEFTADDGTIVYTPVARFNVDQGYRYRFRIINNAALNCPIEVSVDSHTLTVISSDGNDIEPIEAESVVTYAGERYDIIINADQEEGLYWIRFRGLMDCDDTYNSCYQEAVLQYAGFSDYDYPEESTSYDEAHKEGLQINSLDVGMETVNESTLSIAYLRSVEEMEDRLMGTPDFQYIVALFISTIDNPMFHKQDVYGFNDVANGFRSATPQINHISTKFLSFPLLPGRDYLQDDSLCNETTLADSNCVEEYCGCAFVQQVPLDSVVELIFLDTSSATNHPIHLHGHTYRVVGMEHFDEQIDADGFRELDEAGLIMRNFDKPPLKDTVNVPSPGYTAVRFIAHNPGYWFLHCHLEYHTALGMGFVLKVGDNDEMLPVPESFPQCGDYNEVTLRKLA